MGLLSLLSKAGKSLDMFLTIILSLSTVTSIVDAKCESYDREKCFIRWPEGTREVCHEKTIYGWGFDYKETCRLISGKYQ